jgi:hypothetical protein
VPVAGKYGAETSYQLVHQWVNKVLGRPKKCVACGLDDPKRRYHWANISGKYLRDLHDWRRLCVPCHMRDKHPGLCRNGHPLTPENIYVRGNGGECLACKRAHRKLRYWRSKEAVAA